MSMTTAALRSPSLRGTTSKVLRPLVGIHGYACRVTMCSEPCRAQTGPASGTANDICTAGVCTGVPSALRCDDGNVCTDDTSSASAGCAHSCNANSCDDGASCSSADSCVDGICGGADNCSGDFSCDVEESVGVAAPHTPRLVSFTGALGAFKKNVFKDGDVASFEFSAPNGSRVAAGSLFFDESTVNSGTDIDAITHYDEGRMLLSTTGSATLWGRSFGERLTRGS